MSIGNGTPPKAGAGALGVRTVGRRVAHGREQRGEIGGVVVGHVVDAMRGRRRIEEESHGKRDVGMVADRHALPGRKASHHRHRLRDVRIAVAVDERQPEHARVETFHREEEALGCERAQRVGVDRRARSDLVDQAAAVRAVDQARARDDEAFHGRSAGGACEVLRAQIVDRVSLLGSCATEERSAVNDGESLGESASGLSGRSGDELRMDQPLL